MVAVDGCLVLCFKLRVGLLACQSTKREQDAVGLVASAVHGSQGGKRRVRVGSHGAPVALHDAHHAESEVVDLDHLAHKRRSIARNELFGLLIAYHQHLALLLKVDIVDESPGQHVQLVDGCLIGINATKRGTDVVVAHGDGGSRLLHFRTHRFHILAETLACGADVAVVEGNVASFLQAIVRFRGGSSKHRHRVGEEVAHIVRHAVDKSIARSQQHDNHIDAPRHGKSRERSAQLVAAYRGVDFLNEIEHGFSPYII